MSVRISKPLLILASGMAFFVTQPVAAFADNPANRKAEAPGTSEACRTSVRPTSESAPVRRNDCPKARRILM